MLNTIDGDVILEQLLTECDEQNRARLANDMLRALFRAILAQRVRSLLASARSDVVRSGAWLVSELGVRAQPLRDELLPLLKSQDEHVRHYAIDSALTCCAGEDGEITAAVLACLEDPHRGVRYKAAHFLFRASLDQLKGALAVLERNPLTTNRIKMRALSWLVSSEASTTDGVSDALASDLSLMWRFGLAAAIRLFGTDPTVLEIAAQNDDPEIKELATRALRGM